MAHVIIGIHGLSNKPEEGVLSAGWLDAINEGLKENCQITGQPFEFKLVYWADAAHSPQQTSTNQPYRPASPSELPLSWGERGLEDAVRQAAVRRSTRIFARFRLVRWIRSKVFSSKALSDLKRYYDPESKSLVPLDGETNFREVLIGRLHNELMSHKDDNVMVIAHSMGSIIAYDVLRNLGRPEVQMEITDLATIGSPLGFDIVRKNIDGERDLLSATDLRLRTPTVVNQRWGNYADPGDKVAINWNLAKFYGTNRRSVRVTDMIVHNAYTGDNGKRNKHKSYGYLRTPELSAHIRNFLSRR